MLLLILGNLNRARFDCVAVCPTHGGLSEKIANLNVAQQPIDELKARFAVRPDLILRYLWSFLRTMLEFRRIVARQNPDLIHANSTRAGLVATAATIGLRARVVWHLHDVLPAHPLSAVIRLFAVCFRRASMIAVSNAVAAAFLGRGLPARWFRIATVHNAIEIARFARDENAAAELRRELNLDSDAIVFGIAGQITRRKGQLELIRAFAEAVKTVPNTVLLVVGAAIFNRDDEYRKLLVETARALGVADKVIFTGKRADIARVFSALDVLVLNSHNEPFGLVLIEAMAVETAVLAAAVDGVPEIVTHNRTGWLVPPRDEAALTAALIELSCNPELRRRLGEEGSRHARSVFAAEKYIAAIENYYNGLLPAKIAPVNRALESRRVN